MLDPFKGKPKSGEGKFEIPSEDTTPARVVGLIDLGTHLESFQGAEPKPKRQVLLAFELDELDSQRQNFIVCQRYNLSFHEKSGLRIIAESLLNDGKKFDADYEIDYKALLNQPCQVQIAHESKGDKTYHKVVSITPLPKRQRETCFKPQRKPVSWFIGADIKGVPGWLPFVYGEPATDIIKRCQELQEADSGDDGDEGEVGAGVGKDDSTPF